MDGRREIILWTGDMFSGKTGELIIMLIRNKYARKKVIAFYPIKAERSEHGYIGSRTKAIFPATPVESPREIIPLAKDYEVVAIDEAHFFGEENADLFTSVCFTLFLLGKKVYVVSLDTDYTGRPFEITTKLMAIPEVKIRRLTAICIDCGDEATRSHRLTSQEERLAVGDNEYIALCYNCFVKRNPQYALPCTLL